MFQKVFKNHIYYDDWHKNQVFIICFIFRKKTDTGYCVKVLWIYKMKQFFKNITEKKHLKTL